MKCKYEGCNSSVVQNKKESPYYGYCYGHALSLNLVPKEDRDKRKDKIGKARRELYNGTKLSSDVIPTSKQKKTATEKKQELVEKATKIYEEALGFTGFKLERTVKEAVDAGGDLDIEGKNLFLLWWISDPFSRSPRNLRDVAKLLKRTEYELKTWITEEWFLEKLSQQRSLIHKLISPLVDKTNIVQAIVGDSKAKEIFYKQMNIAKEKEEDDPFKDVDDNMFFEAEEITGIRDNKSGGIRVTKDEEEIAEGVSRTLSISKRLKSAN